jgi:hypothetical protein
MDLSIKIAEANVKNEALADDVEEKIALIDSIRTLTCQEGIDLVVDLSQNHKWPIKRGE